MLHTSKIHGRGDKPQIIKIAATTLDASKRKEQLPLPPCDRICPFQILQNFLQVRGHRRNNDEQFFIFNDHSPVTGANFRLVLIKLFRLADLDPAMYGSHGFHAGRVVDMLEVLHLSVESIKKFGRWKSNAVYRYLSHLDSL